MTYVAPNDRKAPETLNPSEAHGEAQRLGFAIQLHGASIVACSPGKRAAVVQKMRALYDELREMDS